MKLQLKSNLPEFVSFTDGAHAVAFVTYLVENHDWTREANTTAECLLEDDLNWILHLYNNKCVSCWQRGPCADLRGKVYDSFNAAVKDFFDSPIQIGDYSAEIQETGVQVGCTFVAWETIEQLLAKRPTK